MTASRTRACHRGARLGDQPRDAQRRAGMDGDVWRTVALLGIPTVALALATTVVTTYLPVVATDIVGSTSVIGLIIGTEGVMALWLPLVVGSWSDRLQTRLGGRLPFLLVGTPVLGAGLVGVSLAGSTGALALATVVFFVGYFLAYEPYRALYPDAVPDEFAGRAQATQAAWRGAGTGLALLGGGLLLDIGRATPFMAAAALVAVGITAFVVGVVKRGVPDRPRSDAAGPRDAAREVLELIRADRRLRAFLLANALWELSLGALKTFIVLYVSVGLGFTRASAGLIIGSVAVGVLLASLAAGGLADRFGHARVMGWALPLFGIGLLGPLLFAQRAVVAAAIPFVAAGGGALMALPYSILMPLMPDDAHGVLSGYYSFSRGLGTWVGPLLAGLSISALGGVFSATHGYQAMWLPVSAAALLSLLPLRALR